MKSIIVWINLISVFLMLSIFGTVAKAQNLYDSAPNGGENFTGNRMDPDYVYTPEELARIADKQSMANQHMKERQLAFLRVEDNTFPDIIIQPYAIGGKTLSVGTWKEPNDWDHRNYCGPGATQVALDARLPASSVPNIETLAQEEYLNPNWGVYINNITPVLNNRLSTTWYVTSGSGSATTLYSRIVSDIDNNYAMITGVVTNNMPGWGGYGVNHIVAVYGYNEPTLNNQYVKYTETAGSVAGYSGSYFQQVTRQQMWTYVSPNDAQSW